MAIGSVFNLSELTHGSPQPDYRLSDARAFFNLVNEANTSLTIREPVGWDGAEWTLSRDQDWHGFNAEYAGQEATLKFREVAAVAFIEAAYQAKGASVTVLLEWGLQFGSGAGLQTLPMQTLKLKLAKRVLMGNELTVPAERLSIHPDIRARWDTTLSMSATQALVADVNRVPLPITPPIPAQLVLHAKRIKQTTVIPAFTDRPDTDWQSFQNTGGSILQGGNPLEGLTGSNVYRDFYISLPFSFEKANPNEVEGYSSSLMQVDTTLPAPILTTKQQGEYRISVMVDFQADARLQTASL